MQFNLQLQRIRFLFSNSFFLGHSNDQCEFRREQCNGKGHTIAQGGQSKCFSIIWNCLQWTIEHSTSHVKYFLTCVGVLCIRIFSTCACLLWPFRLTDMRMVSYLQMINNSRVFFFFLQLSFLAEMFQRWQVNRMCWSTVEVQLFRLFILHSAHPHRKRLKDDDFSISINALKSHCFDETCFEY